MLCLYFKGDFIERLHKYRAFGYFVG